MTKPAEATKTQRPSIYEYIDAQLFFKDWFAFLKTQGVSMRELARRAKIASGFLPMVLKGERTLTEKVLQALSPHLCLDQPELKYLGYILELAEAQTQKEKVNIFNKMKMFKGFKDSNERDLAVQKLLTRWYYAAIYEMSYLPGFKDDAEWIQGHLAFPVSIRDIKEALTFLEEKEFLVRAANGKLVVSRKEITCTDGIYRLAMSEFHKQMLGLATESLFSIERELRQLLTHTMALENSKVDEAKLILHEALKKIQQLGDDSVDHEVVYQFSLLMFPLSKKEARHG